MFDFAMSGPIMGILASLMWLMDGLQITVTWDADQLSMLPSVPIAILQSTTLGSALVEWFLGPGILVSGLAQPSVLPLHDFAIAGLVGLITNALALLPLGSTY
jgi:hypothetical protein